VWALSKLADAENLIAEAGKALRSETDESVKEEWAMALETARAAVPA
jgi:hypothetical protein